LKAIYYASNQQCRIKSPFSESASAMGAAVALLALESSLPLFFFHGFDLFL
jgi:hypothetical protein